MPTIVHFEIPSDNIERTKKFYTDLFGWEIEKWSGTDDSQLTSAATGQPMEYWMVATTDDNGNKAIGGGMMKRQMPEQRITNYIDVKSVDEYSSKVKKLGGKVVAAKKAVPGMGYFVLCLDTENNSFAIWESYHSAK
ncbi:MAG TPA: VOC family protein [Candidatus Nitrosopolaris sp.]|nr:VOC family protein [Candidatus Nitrosopolaris sp.]